MSKKKKKKRGCLVWPANLHYALLSEERCAFFPLVLFGRDGSMVTAILCVIAENTFSSWTQEIAQPGATSGGEGGSSEGGRTGHALYSRHQELNPLGKQRAENKANNLRWME